VTDCKHDWQPIVRWNGRYRCSLCEAIGYRAITNEMPTAYGRRTSEIVPYRCSKCSEPAVRYGKRQFCREHNKPKV
jgi:hypothetical protein